MESPAVYTTTKVAHHQNRSRTGVHPVKFNLWLFLVSVVMLFAAFTSAYIVRRAEGQWVSFTLPNAFYISTFLALVTSLLLSIARSKAKNDQIFALRLFTFLPVLTGSAFVATQFWGFNQLIAEHVYLVGNAAGSFFYGITTIHALHVIGGIIALLVTMFSVWRYRVHSKRMLGIDMTATYWHFVDGLWIYLFVFFLLLR